MSGIQLHYPDLTWYWLAYGTPEDPNAGKDALLRDIRAVSAWDKPHLPESPSVGLFQQIPSSWSSA